MKDTIESLNDQIKSIESRQLEEEEEKFGTQMKNINWKQVDSYISGFYTQPTSSIDQELI